jgi:DnaJ like chaperone protein
MAKFGKWVGLGLGWALGGPIGGILGLAVGSIFDSGTPGVSGQGRGDVRTRTLRGDYAASLLVLIAAVMKADGRVMKSELDYVKRYFVTRFGEDTASEAVVMLRDILRQEIPLRDVTQQMAQKLDYSYRLEMLHFLFGIASADGSVSDRENEVMHKISGYMGITASDFESIRAMFVSQTDASYRILEIEPTSSDEEVKKAFRRMAMKYHPDKVSHLGEDFKKVAHEKFRKVQDAYDQIKKERGLN